VYFGLLFFVGLQIGPGVVLGDVSAGEVLFMLFVMAGLSVVFFAGPMGEVEKTYSHEEE